MRAWFSTYLSNSKHFNFFEEKKKKSKSRENKIKSGLTRPLDGFGNEDF